MAGCSPRRGGTLVAFVVDCAETRPGEHLRVVGEPAELGRWDPASSGVELRTTSEDFPTWRSAWVALPAGSCEYKYVICRADGAARLWEAGPNREFHAGAGRAKGGRGRMTVIRSFNSVCTRCLVEDAPNLGRALTLPSELLEGLPGQESPSKLSRSTSLGLLPLSFGLLDMTAEEGATSPMRRWASIGCIAELPAGLVPSRRALGLVENGSDLIREANYNDGAEPDTPSKKGAAAGRSFSSISTDWQERSLPSSDQSSKGDQEEGGKGDHEQDKICLEQAQEEHSGDAGQRKQTFDECYGYSDKLGQGAFGIVYSCVARESGRRFAVKVVNKDRLSAFALAQLLGDALTGKEGEIRLHGSLPQHRNIVGLHDCFEEIWGVRLVMDVCRGGDLFDAIFRAKQSRNPRPTRADLGLSEQAARVVMRQVLSAIAFCHRHGVVHRDLKAENVLIEHPLAEVPLERDEAVVKVCDFGLAARCWSAASCMTDPVGSPDYVAPEVARLEPYGRGVDVWSCGALLFVSLRGCMPFPGRTDQQALEMVRAGRIVFDGSWEHIPPGARACVEHMMQLDASARPTAEQALEHSWLQGSP